MGGFSWGQNTFLSVVVKALGMALPFHPHRCFPFHNELYHLTILITLFRPKPSLQSLSSPSAPLPLPVSFSSL